VLSMLFHEQVRQDWVYDEDEVLVEPPEITTSAVTELIEVPVVLGESESDPLLRLGALLMRPVP